MVYDALVTIQFLLLPINLQYGKWLAEPFRLIHLYSASIYILFFCETPFNVKTILLMHFVVVSRVLWSGVDWVGLGRGAKGRQHHRHSYSSLILWQKPETTINHPLQEETCEIRPLHYQFREAPKKKETSPEPCNGPISLSVNERRT